MNQLQIMMEAARAGGQELKNYFGGVLEINQKNMPRNFVTQADLASERVVSSILRTAFPDYNFEGEEGGFFDNHSPYTFVVDPLDGTYNFSVGLPHFSVLIGLLHHDEVIAGVAYEPMQDRMFYAQKLSGAFMNGQRIYVSDVNALQHVGVTYTCDYATPVEQEQTTVMALRKAGVKRVFNMWGVDFCWLASGKIDACVMDGAELHDFAAVKIIAREAGGIITDFMGNSEENDRNNKFLVTNGTAIHGQILSIIQSAKGTFSTPKT